MLTICAFGLSASELAKAPEKHASFGFAFHYEYDQAVMQLNVCAIRPNSPAQTAGLQHDDRIVAVDGRTDFKNSLEVLTYLFSKKPREEVKLRTIRGKQEQQLTLVAVEATPEQVEATRQMMELAKEEAAQHRVSPPSNSP